MTPKKRSQGKSTVVSDRPTRAKRAKTIRPSELREVAPEAVSATTSHSQTEQTPVPQAGSVDASTLTNTISAAVSQAIQSALSADNLAAVLKNTGPGTSSVLSLVEDEVSAITQDTNLSAYEVQITITGRRRVPNSSPREPDAGELVSNLRGLLGSALTDSSRRQYQ